jgi:hypothetical protein
VSLGNESHDVVMGLLPFVSGCLRQNEIFFKLLQLLHLGLVLSGLLSLIFIFGLLVGDAFVELIDSIHGLGGPGPARSKVCSNLSLTPSPL